MFRLWAIMGLFFCSASMVVAQSALPYTPQPLGGPIVGPDGKILSGMDRQVSPWSGSFDAGLNGADGNTQLLKLRVGVDFKYDTPADVFTLNAWYGLANQNDARVENKALLTVRNEMAIDERFAWFSQGQYEFDDFRDVRRRVAMHTGISYIAIKNEITLLKLRAGAGAAKEFGGPRNRKWIPEGIFGADFEQKITDRIKFTASGDYYPDFEDWSHYRVRVRAAFDIMVDPDLNMFLRLGVQDRYDSQPGNTKANDLDYFATLLFKF